MTIEEFIEALHTELEDQLGPGLRRDGDIAELHTHSGDPLRLDLRALAVGVLFRAKALDDVNRAVLKVIAELSEASMVTEDQARKWFGLLRPQP